MASLQKYSVGGRDYYRIVESRRINGKPRPIPIMHIGPAEELVNRLLSAPSTGPYQIRSYQHGDVAALKAMADRLGLVSIIDQHVPSSHRISVGTTLVLAAINRAVSPCSKRAWATWADETSVHRLFEIKPQDFTSQFFWSRMDEISISALEAIEEAITRKVIQEFNIKLDMLFYDTSNFFTYISSDNERSSLTQRGRNKQKRFDLRQFGFALLVSRDGEIPLCSRTYEGNLVDATVFPHSLTLIRRRLEGLVGSLDEITMVYDKGNNSKNNQAIVDGEPYHYVASLVPTQHKDLMAIPIGEYKTLEGDYLPGLQVHRCKRVLWGIERTLVLFISEKLRHGQIRGLNQHLTKCLAALQEWKQALSKPGSGPQSIENANKQIESILAQQHIKEIVKVEYNPRRKGADRLSWQIDQEAIVRLHTEVFGKRILMTDQHKWSDEEIVRAYNGQSKVEKQFRQAKDPDHLAVRPQYHWTDQKIRVHVSICLIALMLAQLIQRTVHNSGFERSVPRILDELATVRLAMVLSSSGKRGGRPKCHWQLEERSPQILSLFRTLVPNREPFVYTLPNAG